jgi:site-specific DNA recombinase
LINVCHSDVRLPSRAPPTESYDNLRHDLERAFPAEQARIVQLRVERVDVQEDALEVRIRAEGLMSLVGELWQQSDRKAA